MTVKPIASEVFARIRADHRANRGPFAHAVVVVHELVSHYDVRNLNRTQAKWALRQLCAREVRGRGDSIFLWIAHPDCPLIEAERPAVLAEYRRARGLPVPSPTKAPSSAPRPEPKPSDREASAIRWAAIRGRLAADIAARSGPFHLDVLTVAEVMEFYGAGFGPQYRVSAMLRELTRRRVIAQTKDRTKGTTIQTALYVVADDPELLAEKPRGVLNLYRRARGLADA